MDNKDDLLESNPSAQRNRNMYYRIATAVGALTIAYGLISQELVALWITLGGELVLLIGTVIAEIKSRKDVLVATPKKM